MKKYYSRLAEVSRAQNTKVAVKYTLATLVLLLLLVTLGIPAATRLSLLITDARGGVITKNDKTAPPSPDLKDLPEYTNKNSIDIAGNTEPGARVIVSVNNINTETLAGNDGDFTATVNLNSQDNKISAVAKDESGNASPASPTVHVILDTTIPDLTISNPPDGATFYSNKNKTISVQGKTEPNVNVLINDRSTSITEDGSFKLDYTLTEGENTLTIKATDKAGNEKETQLSITFKP